ncbi:DgyrCDS12727 [Dimorphilus gyrociliatus]|uniref:DgyrCDS12727 n=1 Tax=Dimorphilus gyrociliatus TaxID=2664684 RepID=A0A7I8W7Y6_9ANNE|nr:DgyrCDS12727 [Dimorphilus gyrociliatus]
MKQFKPPATIFEIHKKRNASVIETMKQKREKHAEIIEANAKRSEERKNNQLNESISSDRGSVLDQDVDLENTFGSIIAPKPKMRRVFKKDDESFVPYKPKDFASENGLSLKSSFEKDASNAMMDLIGDDQDIGRKLNNHKKWDRKKMKFVGETNDKKKIKTESGQWISSTYKSKVYKEWLDKTKMKSREEHADMDNDDRVKAPKKARSGRLQVLGGESKFKRGFHTRREETKANKNKRELKRKDEIVKERRKKANLQARMKHREKRKRKR